MATHELEGIHEVQVGDLENRNDDAAIEAFEAIYRRWHTTVNSTCRCPAARAGGRCSTATCRC